MRPQMFFSGWQESLENRALLDDLELFALQERLRALIRKAFKRQQQHVVEWTLLKLIGWSQVLIPRFKNSLVESFRYYVKSRALFQFMLSVERTTASRNFQQISSSTSSRAWNDTDCTPIPKKIMFSFHSLSVWIEVEK